MWWGLILKATRRPQRNPHGKCYYWISRGFVVDSFNGYLYLSLFGTMRPLLSIHGGWLVIILAAAVGAINRQLHTVRVLLLLVTREAKNAAPQLISIVFNHSSIVFRDSAAKTTVWRWRSQQTHSSISILSRRRGRWRRWLTNHSRCGSTRNWQCSSTSLFLLVKITSRTSTLVILWVESSRRRSFHCYYGRSSHQRLSRHLQDETVVWQSSQYNSLSNNGGGSFHWSTSRHTEGTPLEETSIWTARDRKIQEFAI